MKVLMLGCREYNNSFLIMKKILELEKVSVNILLFEDSADETLIKRLKGSDFFILCPDGPSKAELCEDKNCRICANRSLADGYVLANPGRILIYSGNGFELSSIYAGEPVARAIGEVLSFFRREKKVHENQRVLIEMRRIVSEAQLSFSNAGFIQAVECGMYKEAQAFLRAGFSADIENSEGVGIFSLAVRNGDIEICRLLMSYNASLNIIARDRRSSPLMDAVSADKLEIAELLIKAGVDLNFRNRNGQTALIVAIGARMTGIAVLLIESGADLLVKDSLGMIAADYAKLFKLTELYEKLGVSEST